MESYSLFHLMFMVLYFAEFGRATAVPDAECSTPQRCKKGPAVRFPFRLRGSHPPNCGHPDPAFELSCDRNHLTVMHLNGSAELFVKGIDYGSQEIEMYDPEQNCLQRHILDENWSLNLSASPFRYAPSPYQDSTRHVLYNCSVIDGYRNDGFNYIPCLSNRFYGVTDGNDYSSILDLAGCRKIPVTRFFPSSMFALEATLFLNWSEPNCRLCEEQRKGCRLKNHAGTETETECFDLPKQSSRVPKRTLVLVTGAIVACLLSIGLYWIHRSHKLKKENEFKIKQFLEDYRALKATRYSYADIKRITDRFKQKVGQGGYGQVYKGKLANDILVAVKILTNNSAETGGEFINEVGAMGRIHHINVARLVGFCGDGPHRALVYEFLPNESLEKFIFPENGGSKRVVLGWDKLRDISLGIARGLEYLHHGCDQQILHFDIKPHNILLDHNFVPKISDFGLAKLCSKDKSVVTMTAARGTMGYIAPEVASRNFGSPSYKSDVYSFGMLLLEMVGGRKNIDVTVENTSQVYFPEWVHNHLDHGGEVGIEIEDEGHAKISRKLTIVGLQCIQWHPSDRPSMKVVVQMLEGDRDDLAVPPNPFVSSKS